MNDVRTALFQFVLATVAAGLLAGCTNKGDDSTGTTSDATTQGSASDTAGSASDTAGSASEPTTGEAVAGCECISNSVLFESEMYEVWGRATYTCPIKCGAFAECSIGTNGETTVGDSDTDSGCGFLVSEEELNCILDTLIQGDAGAISWGYTPDQGFSSQGGFVEVLPNREGLTRTYTNVDAGQTDSAAGVVPLKAAAYFQGCKDLADLEARFWCMTKWSEQEPTAQCDGPGEYVGTL